MESGRVNLNRVESMKNRINFSLSILRIIKLLNDVYVDFNSTERGHYFARILKENGLNIIAKIASFTAPESLLWDRTH